MREKNTFVIVGNVEARLGEGRSPRYGGARVRLGFLKLQSFQNQSFTKIQVKKERTHAGTRTRKGVGRRESVGSKGFR